MARGNPSKSELIIANEILRRDYDFLRELHEQAADDMRRLAQYGAAAERLLKEAETYSPAFAAEHRAELARLRAALSGESEQEAEQAPSPFGFLNGRAEG
jgi:uncharacterized protein YaaN involved in tellurite resistance